MTWREEGEEGEGSEGGGGSADLTNKQDNSLHGTRGGEEASVALSSNPLLRGVGEREGEGGEWGGSYGLKLGSHENR